LTGKFVSMSFSFVVVLHYPDTRKFLTSLFLETYYSGHIILGKFIQWKTIYIPYRKCHTAVKYVPDICKYPKFFLGLKNFNCCFPKINCSFSWSCYCRYVACCFSNECLKNRNDKVWEFETSVKLIKIWVLKNLLYYFLYIFFMFRSHVIPNCFP
jgi:hypothetical protein